MKATREQIRRAVEGIERRGRGRPFPRGVRRAAIAYCRARRRDGATLLTVGEEIGIAWRTLSRWCQEEPGDEPSFHRVELVEQAAPPTATLCLHGPCGVRVEGLDVDQLVEVFRRLG